MGKGSRVRPSTLLVSVIVAGLFTAMAVYVRAASAAGEWQIQFPPPLKRETVVDVVAMLHAIRDVESGDRPTRIGPKGERSAYQFKEAIWRFHTRVPFRVESTNPEIAETIAQRHFEQLRKEFANELLPFTPEFIAAAWHHGSPGAAAHVRDDYAQRAARLYALYATQP